MTTSTPFGGPSTVPIDDTDTRADDHYELVQRWGRPMATDVSVQIAVPSSRWAEAAAAADACMDWFDEVDAEHHDATAARAPTTHRHIGSPGAQP